MATALEKHPPPAAVQVSAEIPADLPAANVDAQQIGMAPGNLVTNAYQAMPEGGRLTLSAGAEEETVVLSAADAGRGIPPEHMDKLFEPLLTTKARGIGLGPAVSRDLVEANGGSVHAESEGTPGKGSTFTVRRPMAHAAHGE